MSTVTVIAGIVVLLAALVSYAFISQTLQNKREQRKRLLAALKSQARSFRFVLESCPDGFLPKELKIILLKSLTDISEQLLALEPSENVHSQNIQAYSAKLTETQKSAPSKQMVQLETPQQIKEVKVSLEELHKFIFNLESQRKITKNQAEAHRAQVKMLVLRLTVDGYVLNGKAAKQNGKTKLALHYFDLALKLLIREGKAGMFDNKIAQLKEVCAELKEALAEEEAQQLPTGDDSEVAADLEEEWDQFSSSSSDDLWKKKNVYD